MTNYETAELHLDDLISGLYIPEGDEGYLSGLLRSPKIRRANIKAGYDVDIELVSIVDVVSLAGYASATTNWRNIINCYFQPTIMAKSWLASRTQAKSKYINPRITGDMRGKTAVVPFNVAVSVLCRLPATKDQAIADVHRIYSVRDELMKQFYMQPLSWG